MPRQTRDNAELAHEMWEWSLEDVHPGYLHRSCASLNLSKDSVPRQTMAWLIADFCDRHNIGITTLCDYITAANEDIHMPGLMWLRDSDQRTCFNLLKLSDLGLYRVYTEIPEHLRPSEKPPLEPKEPKERKERKLTIAQKQKAEQKQLLSQQKLQEGAAVEENFAWVQCDVCDKWRRLINTKEDDVPEQWECKLHPQGNITCDTAEDAMDEGEQWDGKTRGTKLRISICNGTATARVVDGDGNSIAGDNDSSSSDQEELSEENSSSHPQSLSGSMPSNEGEPCTRNASDASEDGSDGEDVDLFGDDDDDDDSEF